MAFIIMNYAVCGHSAVKKSVMVLLWKGMNTRLISWNEIRDHVQITLHEKAYSRLDSSYFHYMQYSLLWRS